MKVSIITVCFNSAETLRDTIESVLAQSHGDIEHIIVDGASTDNTLAIANEYRHSLGALISEPDKGLYDAMNKGVMAATGEIIGVLNSDDFFESTDVISTVVKAFEAAPETDLVFGDVVYVSPDDLDTVTRFYQAGHFRPWKLRFGWMPPHPATFVRKTLYGQSGTYRLDMKIAADYEMFVRWMLVNRCHYTRLNKVIVRMRAGGISTAGIKSSLLLNREIVQACRDNGIYTNLLMVLCKIPFKLLELSRRPNRQPSLKQR